MGHIDVEVTHPERAHSRSLHGPIKRLGKLRARTA